MTRQSRYAEVKARLEGSGLAVFDGPIGQLTPTAAEYCVLYDDSVALAAGYVQTSPDAMCTYRTTCVSRRGRAQVRATADAVSALLTDWTPRPGLTDMFVEVESGPIIAATEGSDTRYSVTLVHRTFTPRSTV